MMKTGKCNLRWSDIDMTQLKLDRLIKHFTQSNKAEGKYEIWLTLDMVVLTEQQQEVFKKENAVDIHYQTSSPRLDIYGVNQLTLAEIPPGKYLFMAILHDKIKGEEASATWAFEVIQ